MIKSEPCWNCLGGTDPLEKDDCVFCQSTGIIPFTHETFMKSLSSLDQNICADCSAPIPAHRFLCKRCGDE